MGLVSSLVGLVGLQVVASILGLVSRLVGLERKLAGRIGSEASKYPGSTGSCIHSGAGK